MEFLLIGIVILLLCISNALSQLRTETARTNAILQKLSKQLGVPNDLSMNIDDELKKLIESGRKIQAIKRYREFTGLGLKEAKDYVDSL